MPPSLDLWANATARSSLHSRRATELDDIWASLPQYSAAAGKLKMSGRPFQLKGASWFGAEGVGKAPDGLWVHNVTFYLRFLSQNGFNAVRLPFALDNVLSDSGPSINMVRSAPYLRGLSYLQVLERVVDAAANIGMLVLFDLQRLDSTKWPDDGLWYTSKLTIEDVKQAWDIMQSRFCNRWNTLGADVLNEPHGATWIEWTQAAATLGNYVLSRCPRWVVFVEGVAHERKNVAGEYFWGENLAMAGKHPVNLQLPDKLVYSPHTYGPGRGDDEAHHMPYFDEKEFPRNMEKLWMRHFGHLLASGATVVVGEWGGPFEGKDRQWQEAFSRFLRDRQLSSFYWSLNPNSEDTGGLLADDWTSPQNAKLSLLRSHPSTRLSSWLSGRPSFRCPSGPVPANLHRCADTTANECILSEQLCNGVYECRDRSDEWTCNGQDRPCMTVLGGRWGSTCVFPFTYNGFEYSSCTLVDAIEMWTLVGAGRCQQGYIASLAASGVTLDECQQRCARTANCSFVSFTAAQSFCGGYGASCEGGPLHAGGDYATYRFNEEGGAWCATSVGEHGEYLASAHAGTCGPGCARPKLAGEPSRSRCMDNGAHSDGGVAHCAPSPPPPPAGPPPPAPPPHLPPPFSPPPPAAPPPWFASVLLLDPYGLGLLALLLTCCVCLCWAQVRHAQLAPKRPSRRRQAGRPLSVDELESLAEDEPSGPFPRRGPPPKRSQGRPADCGNRDPYTGRPGRSRKPSDGRTVRPYR